MLFPASKLGDLIIGVDAHTVTLPPPAPPIPLMPHPFIGYIFLWWSPNFPSYNVFVNGMPALTLGAKSISVHFPMPPGIWWVKLPCPAKFFITHYTTVLLSTMFSLVLNTAGAMTGTTVPTTRTPLSQMDPPPENPNLWGALSAQINGFSWTSILRMLLPPVVLPISEGDVNMASPTVTVNGGPMSFVGPLFSGSCSEIPIIPNSNVLGFSNVMVGVTLKEILMQLAWNVVHGLANLAASKLGAKFGTWVAGEPVDMVSGAVWVKQTDFKVPGPIPVEFTRSYINCVNEFGPLGYNWTHTYNQFLRIENDAIFYYNDQGRPIRLPLLSVGGQHQNKAESLRFEHPEQDTFVMHTKSGQTLIFRLTTLEPVARLIEILDRSRNRIRLEYTGTRLVRLIDSVERRFGFFYDTLGRLVEVRFKGQGSSLADSPLVSFEYDGQGDLAAAFDSAGHARRFAYNQYHWLTRHTNRNGFSVQYEYDNSGQCVRTWADDGKYGGVAEYLTAARITRWTNFRDHTWTYFYDEQNLVTQIVDPLGYSRKLAWSPDGHLLSATDQAGFATSYEYDERGSCTRRIDAAGGVFTQAFNANGDLIEYMDAEGATVHHEYDDEGRLTAFVDEMGLRWEHRYLERGLVHEFTSPDGLRRRSERSADWSTLELSDPDGVYSRKRFDALGHLIASEDHRGVKYQFWNTPQGWIEEIVGPEGVVGRYTYDGEGNPKSFTDANGAKSHYSFEGLHRAVRAENPSQEQQFYSYEPVDEKVAALTDAEGQRVAFEYDACERLRRQEFFDGRWTECTYDGRGLLVKMTFSSGLEFDFTYDALGRTIRWHASDGTFAEYEYDRVGRCVRAVNATSVLEFSYDPISRLIREQQGDVSIEYEYDVHDNVVRRTNSLTGRQVSFEYSGSKIRAIRDGNGGFQEILRDASNRSTIRRFSNGVEETIYHTIHGEMQSQVVRSHGSVLAQREYARDIGGRIVGLRDKWRGDQRFEYDGARRLLAIIGSREKEVRFSYDRNDNLRTSSLEGNLIYSSGNRIEQAGPIAFSHDSNGNVASMEKDGRRMEFRCDALGRLTTSFDRDGVETEYGYDALGRRAYKRTGGVQTRYYWQDYALMLENGDGSAPLEYVIMPGSFVPFMIWKGSELHHHIVDHLGTVQEMIGPDGQLSWQGRLAPWGELSRTSVVRVENNLRFPGQYYDGETGLHYNLNRYYDPRSGRYMSPDPAGLAAGLNQYRYVPNPVEFSDPFGLSSRVPASPNAEVHRANDEGQFGTKCPACGVNLHGPGGQVASSPDHVEPYSVIQNMPGYDALTPENQARIQNDMENFVSLCRPCNQSRGNKPYGNGEGEWAGRDGHPMNPRTAAKLKQRQAQLKTDLAERIQDMLDEQAEQEAAGRRGRGGCS